MGQCRNCDNLCGGVSDGFLAGLFGIGVNVSAITNVEGGASVAARINGEGRLNAPPGTLMQLNGSSQGALRELLFASAQGSADAVAQVTAGAQLALRNVEASGSAGAQILLDAGADFAVAALQIAQQSSLTLQLGGGARAGRTAANFSSLNLAGPLNVAGDNSTFFIFPRRDDDCNSTSEGSVQVSGGINMQGRAGSVRINIAGSAQSGSSLSASVALGASFAAGGPILGATATLAVQGSFSMRGLVLEPLLNIGAQAFVDFQSDPTQATMAGNVSFTAGSGARNQFLVINGTAAGTAGENIFFQTIANCPASATIRLNVNGTASAALAKGVTVFNYNVATYASTTSFLCAIEVCGLVDGLCVAVTNPNAGAAAGARRLLSTTSSAAFNPTSLTVSSSSAPGGAPTGSAPARHAAINAASTLALVFAALVAAMRM